MEAMTECILYCMLSYMRYLLSFQESFKEKCKRLYHGTGVQIYEFPIRCAPLDTAPNCLRSPINRACIFFCVEDGDVWPRLVIFFSGSNSFTASSTMIQSDHARNSESQKLPAEENVIHINTRSWYAVFLALKLVDFLLSLSVTWTIKYLIEER